MVWWTPPPVCGDGLLPPTEDLHPDPLVKRLKTTEPQDWALALLIPYVLAFE